MKLKHVIPALTAIVVGMSALVNIPAFAMNESTPIGANKSGIAIRIDGNKHYPNGKNCSATLVENYFVATALHCVTSSDNNDNPSKMAAALTAPKDVRIVKLNKDNHTTADSYPIKVSKIYASKQQDIAFLKLDKDSIPSEFLEKHTPAQMLSGYSVDMGNLTVQGLGTANDKEWRSNSHYYRTSPMRPLFLGTSSNGANTLFIANANYDGSNLPGAATVPGDSGGGVFDSKGRLVAVAFGTMRGNYITDGKVIYETSYMFTATAPLSSAHDVLKEIGITNLDDTKATNHHEKAGVKDVNIIFSTNPNFPKYCKLAPAPNTSKLIIEAKSISGKPEDDKSCERQYKEYYNFFIVAYSSTKYPEHSFDIISTKYIEVEPTDKTRSAFRYLPVEVPAGYGYLRQYLNPDVHKLLPTTKVDILSFDEKPKPVELSAKTGEPLIQPPLPKAKVPDVMTSKGEPLIQPALPKGEVPKEIKPVVKIPEDTKKPQEQAKQPQEKSSAKHEKLAKTGADVNMLALLSSLMLISGGGLVLTCRKKMSS